MFFKATNPPVLQYCSRTTTCAYYYAVENRKWCLEVEAQASFYEGSPWGKPELGRPSQVHEAEGSRDREASKVHRFWYDSQWCAKRACQKVRYFRAWRSRSTNFVKCSSLTLFTSYSHRNVHFQPSKSLSWWIHHKISHQRLSRQTFRRNMTSDV